MKFILSIALVAALALTSVTQVFASPSSDIDVIKSEVAVSTIPSASKALDTALLNSTQMYLALPGGLGKPGACLLLGQFINQANNQIVYDSNASTWVTQALAVKSSIPC